MCTISSTFCHLHLFIPINVLTGLTPFTSYSVQVAAVNDEGTGPYSDPALTVETLQDSEG